TPATPSCMAHTCVSCAVQDDCGAGTVCDAGSGKCVQCLDADVSSWLADCTMPAAPICISQMCEPCTNAIDGDAACATRDATNPACEMAPDMNSHVAGQCVQCTAGDDTACKDGTPVCDTELSECVQCTSNMQCANPTPICNSGDTCEGCTMDSQCPGG